MLATKGLKLLAALRVPQLDGFIPAATDQKLGVRGEGERVNFCRMPSKGSAQGEEFALEANGYHHEHHHPDEHNQHGGYSTRGEYPLLPILALDSDGILFCFLCWRAIW